MTLKDVSHAKEIFIKHFNYGNNSFLLRKYILKDFNLLKA